MGVLTKPRRLSDAPPWVGETVIYYRYTLGVAGERFYREIRENRKLYGTRCPKCQNVYVPAKMYCAECFEYANEWVEIPFVGQVLTHTVLRRDLDDKELAEPIVVAFISFPGATGGMVHRIVGVAPTDVTVGMAVEPVFDPSSTGGPTDIAHFRPVAAK